MTKGTNTAYSPIDEAEKQQLEKEKKVRSLQVGDVIMGMRNRNVIPIHVPYVVFAINTTWNALGIEGHTMGMILQDKLGEIHKIDYASATEDGTFEWRKAKREEIKELIRVQVKRIHHPRMKGFGFMDFQTITETIESYESDRQNAKEIMWYVSKKHDVKELLWEIYTGDQPDKLRI